jgi:rhamnulokinase
MPDMPGAKSFLAFDLGASSGRAILGTPVEGRMEMKEIHRFITPVREDGERLYWDMEALGKALDEGLRLALAESPGLRSVSVDSWGVDYVPLGSDGQPLREAFSYRDPRVRMEEAFKEVPAEEIYAATGIQFLPFNTLYQVLADRDQDPDVFRRTASRLMVADWFNHRFGGRPVAEVSLASTTQLLDPYRRAWAVDLMERFGIAPESWPEIVPSGTAIGTVPGTNVTVVAGCSHDTAAAVVAVPADPGTRWAYLSCGTWSLLGAELPEPVVTPEAYQAGFTNEAGLDGTIRFLKNLTGMWVLEECRREWRERGDSISYDALLAEAEAEDTGDLYIDLNDQRFAHRGQMLEKVEAYCREHGLPVPESRGALVRALMESLAENQCRALRELEAVLGQTFDVVHIVGGGSRNDLLCRLTAEKCGCTVVAGPAEATALGNLLVQARAMGDLPEGQSIRDVVRASTELKVYEPGGKTNPD